MDIIRDLAIPNLSGRPVCCAIGMFDGLHLGHRRVIGQTMAEAERLGGISVAVTFDRHPAEVVAPDRVPSLISDLEERLRLLKSAGIHSTLVIRFDKTKSRQSATVFIYELCERLPPLSSIAVGENFTFGHRRSGNIELLRRLGQELNFEVHGVAAVKIDGAPVSSTRIRRHIREGTLSAAAALLGQPYELWGTVVRGAGLGTKIGIPTANLDVARLTLPPVGVYAIRARVADSWEPGVLNIGFRPTLDEPVPSLQVETHLLDYSGDIYGMRIGLRFVEHLRGEKRFSSVDDLVTQIHRDISTARPILI